jgi:hypothetical protein
MIENGLDTLLVLSLCKLIGFGVIQLSKSLFPGKVQEHLQAVPDREDLFFMDIRYGNLEVARRRFFHDITDIRKGLKQVPEQHVTIE